MSKLSELIKQYCPNGVEYKTLGEVTTYEQPGKYIVSSEEYKDDFDIPVLTAGQTFILGYTDEKEGVYKASKENPVIIFDDFTGAFKWVDFDFKIKSSAIKLIHADETQTTIRYIFHILGYLGIYSSEHKRLWISNHSNLSIPIPPLEVQGEIVRILDNFTELTAELTAELTKRKQQYEYYRDFLLTAKNEIPKQVRNDVCKLQNDDSCHAELVSASHEWKMVKLGEIGKVCMCKRILKEQTNSESGIPFYKIGTFGGIADSYITKELFEEYKEKYSYPKKGDILISAAGTIGKTVIFDGQPSYFQDSNIVWIDNDETLVLNRYLYYFYSTNPWKTATGGTIERLYNDSLRKVQIPLPPLEVQKQIADTLDRFDTLCNDITTGLPAEIEARKKQYEYYREKLLAF